MKRLKYIFVFCAGLLLLSAFSPNLGISSISNGLDTLILKYFVFQDKATGRYYVKPVKGASDVDTSTPVNPPPVADAGKDTVLGQGVSTYTLDGTGSHGQGGSTITSYSWTQTSGGTTTINSPSTDTTTIFGLTVNGNYVYSLTVTDNNGLTATSNVIITVPSLPSYRYLIQKGANFYFSPTVKTIPNYTGVIGDPSISVITATDDSTGWTVSTIGTDTTLWNPDPLLGDKSSASVGMQWTTPSDPYGYKDFDSASLVNGFINYSSQYVPGTYNLKISNLDPTKQYQLYFIGSITKTDSTSYDQGSTRTLYQLSNGRGGSLNTQWRTSKSVIEDTVRPDSEGNIYGSITGQDTTYTNGAIGVISALKILELSKDTGSGTTDLYRNYYDTTLMISDGSVTRLCIVYKPYDYDPNKSYPIFLYMDGQEDAVFDNVWDPQILTGDGMGIVGEGEKGKLYGIDASGDTSSFVTIIPQTGTNEFSLTTSQMHTLLANFKSKELYNTNDSLFLAGFSSGGASVMDYLYDYPSEVTAAFIQSPAATPPSSSVLRDTSAKFKQYGTHVWLVKRGDAFANYIDSLYKYINLGSPNNLYIRYQLAKDHSGFAEDYLPTTMDEVYPQSVFSFFVNPTENRRKVSFFSIWTPSVSNLQFWTPTYNGSSVDASSSVLYGSDAKTGWHLNTVATSKWNGSATAVSAPNVIRNYNFYSTSAVQSGRAIYSSGSYASDGNNLHVSGLSAGKSYTVYMAGFSNAGANPPVITQYGINGTSFTTFCNSCDINITKPAKLVGVSTDSGTIDLSCYADPNSTNAGYGAFAYMIIRETNNDTTHQPPVVNAGSDQSITLPQDSITLSGVANNPNPGGAISSTVWTVVDEPSGASSIIRDASSLSTVAAEMSIVGTYKVELSVTDDSGYIVRDTVQITVNAAPTGSISQFNFNSTAQGVTDWIDVAGSPSAAVVTVTDTTTGWSVSSVSTTKWPSFGGASSGNANGGNVDDGGGFAFGEDVTRSCWYSSSNDTSAGLQKRLLISGLDNAKTYKLEFLFSADPSKGAPAGQTMKVHLNEDAGTFKESVDVDNNSSSLVEYPSVVPTDGDVSVDINSATAKFIVLNGLKITEN